MPCGSVLTATLKSGVVGLLVLVFSWIQTIGYEVDVAVRRRLTPYGEIHVADLVYELASFECDVVIGSSSSTRKKTLDTTDMSKEYV